MVRSFKEINSINGSYITQESKRYDCHATVEIPTYNLLIEANLTIFITIYFKSEPWHSPINIIKEK